VDPTEEAHRELGRTSWVGWRAQRGWDPLLFARASGTRIYDARGKPYLDFASQLVATNLGHGNPRVIRAATAQLQRLAYAQPAFATEVRARVERALRTVMPAGLDRYFWSTSGTEAVEAALKMARLATGRKKILSRTRSYHGSTAGSISVSGDVRRLPVEGSHTVPGTVWAPDCYCYRCPLGLTYPSCHIACAEEVDTLLDREPDVAAMIVEPVVGTNGVLVPVPEYLPRVRAITQQHDVLLIADEVMTGWGRTGAWFAVDHWGVRPDLLATAKGLTSGYLPLGLTASTQRIHDTFADRFFPHGHTYEAHPVPLAAAEAAIQEYKSRNLVARSRRQGEKLLRLLREVGDRHPSVGEVRGIGLLTAVELVRDRGARTPMNSPEEKLAGRPLVVDEVALAMRMAGVLVLPWISQILLAPPLTIEDEELAEGVTALDRALAIADSAIGAPGAAAATPPAAGRRRSRRKARRPRGGGIPGTTRRSLPAGRSGTAWERGALRRARRGVARR
jgi:taurine---2-oxoglutarate transaminase